MEINEELPFARAQSRFDDRFEDSEPRRSPRSRFVVVDEVTNVWQLVGGTILDIDFDDGS